MRPGLDVLAPLYIYLQWISTGSIECAEGGGHFRPNRHAELSRIMFRSCEWVNGDGKKSAMERLVARKMASKLPSFSEAFTASVPLTRIRDIAHRNDIPHDLKQEIKHTLQNKLHRCAATAACCGAAAALAASLPLSAECCCCCCSALCAATRRCKRLAAVYCC